MIKLLLLFLGGWKNPQLKPVPAVKPIVNNIYAAPSQPLAAALPKPKPAKPVDKSAKPGVAKPSPLKSKAEDNGERRRNEKRADSTDSGLSSACDKVRSVQYIGSNFSAKHIF